MDPDDWGHVSDYNTIYTYSGSFIMPETGFLERNLTFPSSLEQETECSSIGCAREGYNTSLSVSHSGVFSSPDTYYIKKGGVVSVGADCGEYQFTCSLSTLKNDFYAVYYPPTKKS